MSRKDVVLVTGGAGFIGSALVADLVEAGHQVIVLDSLVTGRRENLAGLPDDRLTLVIGDVRDTGLVARLVSQVSVVFHLACLGLRHSLHSPMDNHEVNATAALGLLEAARAARVERFVHVSTSEVYGAARTVPMAEDHPTEPSTAYGAAKLAGEAYARAFHTAYGLPTVVVRPFNAFGPRGHHEGDSGEVIPRFLLRALAGRPLLIFGDGKQTRDFTWVTDTARGIRLAGWSDAAIGRTINLGTGREVSIEGLACAVTRLAGRPDLALIHDAARPGDVRRLCADATLARELLHWEPRVGLDDGLAALRDWYLGLGIPAEVLLETEVERNWLPPEGAGPRRSSRAARAGRDGAPAVPLARPELGEPEVRAVRRIIRSGWVSQGPEVEAFEAEFAAAVGARHACAVSSGTTALHLALLAVGVGPGDEVVTASHSFIATAASVRHCGALPVFVDIDPATFNMDPRCVEAAITPRTRAILCVHQLGMPCDLAAILEIAGRRRLPVVEDAACAVGSEVLWDGRWEPIGRPHGDIACFSLHARKVVTTGEGGVITTSRADLDEAVRRRRQHGMTGAAHLRHRSREVVAERYLVPGFNYRLSDLQAAIGREQLRRLPGMIARRRRLAARYAEFLGEWPLLVSPPSEPAWARSNWQSYCVRLADHLDQQAVMKRMLEGGVATRRGVMCAHREPAFPRGTWSCGEPPGGCDCADGTCRLLRESERAQDRCLLLPLYPGMRDAEQAAVVEALRRACDR